METCVVVEQKSCKGRITVKGGGGGEIDQYKGPFVARDRCK